MLTASTSITLSFFFVGMLAVLAMYAAIAAHLRAQRAERHVDAYRAAIKEHAMWLSDWPAAVQALNNAHAIAEGLPPTDRVVHRAQCLTPRALRDILRMQDRATTLTVLAHPGPQNPRIRAHRIVDAVLDPYGATVPAPLQDPAPQAHRAA